MTRPPVWLFVLTPVMEAKHNGEGAGRQQLLVVVVVVIVDVNVIEAVGRC